MSDPVLEAIREVASSPRAVVQLLGEGLVFLALVAALLALAVLVAPLVAP